MEEIKMKSYLSTLALGAVLSLSIDMQPLYANQKIDQRASSDALEVPGIILSDEQKNQIKKMLDRLDINTDIPEGKALYAFSVNKAQDMIEFMSYSIPSKQAYKNGINTMLQVLKVAEPEFQKLGLKYSTKAYQFALNKVILDPSWNASVLGNTEKLVEKVTEEVGNINKILLTMFRGKITKTQVFTAFKFNEAGLEISKVNFDAVSSMQKFYKRYGLSTRPDIVVDQLAFINSQSRGSGVISEKMVDAITSNLNELRNLYTPKEIKDLNLVETALYLASQGHSVTKEHIKNAQSLNSAYKTIFSFVQKNKIDPKKGNAISMGIKKLYPKEIISLAVSLSKEGGKSDNEGIDLILSEIKKADPQEKSVEAKKSDPKAQTSPLSSSVSEKIKLYKSDSHRDSLKEKQLKKKAVHDDTPAKSVTDDDKAERPKK